MVNTSFNVRSGRLPESMGHFDRNILTDRQKVNFITLAIIKPHARKIHKCGFGVGSGFAWRAVGLIGYQFSLLGVDNARFITERGGIMSIFYGTTVAG